MKLEALSPEYVNRAIEHDLRFGDVPEATRVAAISEQLRAAVVIGLVRQDSSEISPVPTINITRPTRHRLSPIWPEVLNEDGPNILLEELRQLEAIGDVVHVKKGWYPAPMRLVEITDSSYLLVGGTPFQLLPRELRAELMVCGRARVVTLSDRTRSFFESMPRQDLKDWIGIQHSDVSTWAMEFKKTAIESMQPTSITENVFVYALNRWVRLGEYSGDSCLSLVRVANDDIQQRGGFYIYGLAKILRVPNKPPKILAMTEISNSEARRLQGAISYVDGNNKVRFKFVGRCVYFRIPHPLPQPESRFLDLGWVNCINDERPWPRVFVFAIELFPLLQATLAYLGYEAIAGDFGVKNV